jgi:hypothetical protein
MKLPWQNEPDTVEFNYKGYDCLIQRVNHRPVHNPQDCLGHLCGYVDLPKGHKYYGKQYDEIPLDVHGGLTYAEGKKNNVWTIGFDCAHFGDLIPGIYELRLHGGPLYGINFDRDDDIYRTVSFVENELKSLVDQLLQDESGD